jgi:hypothetical protein
MKPPICHLCHRHFREANAQFDLVEFADYRPLPEGYIGHPHGLEWFCQEHLAAAQAHSSDTVEAAMHALRKTFGLLAEAPQSKP